MACCNEHNIECCEVCNCFRFSSPNNSIQIDKTGCDVKLQLTPNTLQNLLNIESSGCITVIKQIINGKLVFTPTLNLACIPPPSASITANNGLNMSTPTNVQLGGTLLKNTLVDLDTFDLSLLDVTTNTGIIIKPGVTTPGNYGVDTTQIKGKFTVDEQSYFQGNVGVNIQPDITTADTKLTVLKVSALGSNTEQRYIATSSTLGLQSGTDIAPSSYSGLGGGLYIGFSSAETLLSSNTYTAVSGGINFSSQGNVTGGNISAFNAGFTFGKDFAGAPTGDVDKIIGYRVSAPQGRALPSPFAPWNQTITDFVGIQIDDERQFMNGGINNGTITNSWGIRQLGNLDRNYFAGNTGIGTQPYPASDTDPINPLSNNAKLFVGRSSGFRPSSLTTASDTILTFDPASGSPSPNITAGLTGRLNPSPTANCTIPAGPRLAAIYGYMQYTGTEDILNDQNSCLNGVFGQCSFSSGIAASPTGGDISYAAALRAGKPLHVLFSYYGGTIANAYGLYIEDQRGDITGTTNTGTITNSYGIYQEGKDDENIFKAEHNVFPNVVPLNYLNDAAAAGAGIPIGGIYHTNGTLKIRII